MDNIAIVKRREVADMGKKGNHLLSGGRNV